MKNWVFLKINRKTIIPCGFSISAGKVPGPKKEEIT
jgi:hypothetical protein